MKWFYRAKNWIKRYVFRSVAPPKPAARHIETQVTVGNENADVSARRVINEAGLDLIIHFEGYYSTAYKCPAGVWTIGYGTIYYPNGQPVKRGDTCTKEEAKKWLRYELREKEAAITKFLTKYGVSFNDNEFSAMVSFCYNLGTGPLVQTNRSLHKAVITGSRKKITDAMLLYVKAGRKTLRGLVRRRKAEVKLFLS